MTPAPGTTACVFCGTTNGKLTCEHVIPKWARRSFDIKGPVTVNAREEGLSQRHQVGAMQALNITLDDAICEDSACSPRACAWRPDSGVGKCRPAAPAPGTVPRTRHRGPGPPRYVATLGAPRSGRGSRQARERASRAHADRVSVGVPAFAFLLGWADRGRASRRPRHP